MSNYDRTQIEKALYSRPATDLVAQAERVVELTANIARATQIATRHEVGSAKYAQAMVWVARFQKELDGI